MISRPINKPKAISESDWQRVGHYVLSTLQPMPDLPGSTQHASAVLAFLWVSEQGYDVIDEYVYDSEIVDDHLRSFTFPACRGRRFSNTGIGYVRFFVCLGPSLDKSSGYQSDTP
ncbi:Uncharacterised protein [Corynebacterium ulcerans]|uniref:Transposase n=1 Tax=Corynebacterium ulcerans TaxID=65058 RepID=A0ABD7MQU5_CORUL|nr:Uncharacterised protein [Corynebacterium ulcerans]SQG50087.1 Uncharacterised protein [Corynebacterium ulcerans]SQH03694.1 Uncharacterised protein [Corynebacterium ulcerans]